MKYHWNVSRIGMFIIGMTVLTSCEREKPVCPSVTKSYCLVSDQDMGILKNLTRPYTRGYVDSHAGDTSYFAWIVNFDERPMDYIYFKDCEVGHSYLQENRFEYYSNQSWWRISIMLNTSVKNPRGKLSIYAWPEGVEQDISLFDKPPAISSREICGKVYQNIYIIGNDGYPSDTSSYVLYNLDYGILEIKQKDGRRLSQIR